jgi:hypothetical protein
MSDLGFLIVLMRASLMDYRVCERWWEGCRRRLRKLWKLGGWFWYAVASRSRAILFSRDKSFNAINLRRENRSLMCRGSWVIIQEEIGVLICVVALGQQ